MGNFCAGFAKLILETAKLKTKCEHEYEEHFEPPFERWLECKHCGDQELLEE